MIPKLNLAFPLSRAFSSLAFVLSEKGSVYSEGSDFYLNHARTGIRVALSGMKLGAGSRVGVMAFNCVSVMNAAAAAGCDIEFLDVTDDLRLDLEDLRHKKDSLSALVVSHLFGLANDMDRIREICPEIPVIEDCAHALGASFSDCSPVGAKGDFAVFSIGQGKFPSIGDGGILRVNNESYRSSVASIVRSIPRTSKLEELGMIFGAFLKAAVGRSFMYKLVLPRKVAANMAVPSSADYRMTEQLMPGYVLSLWDKEKDNVEGYVSIQRRNFTILSDYFCRCVPWASTPAFAEGQINGFIFPFILSDAYGPEELREINGLEVATHFYKSIMWAEHFGYSGGCPNAEKLASRLRVLPCHYNIDLRKCFLSRN